jgi:hypothetical protein
MKLRAWIFTQAERICQQKPENLPTDLQIKLPLKIKFNLIQSLSPTGWHLSDITA